MKSILIEEIAVKSATLPVEQQRVVLDFVNSMIAQDQEMTAEPKVSSLKLRPSVACAGFLIANWRLWKKIWPKSAARCGKAFPETFRVPNHNEFNRRRYSLAVVVHQRHR